MKSRVFSILEGGRNGDRVGLTIEVFLAALIVLNVVGLVLGTVESIFEKAPQAFLLFELVSVIVFTVEYVARVWSCPSDPQYSGSIRGRLRYMVSPLAVADAAAVAPFYILTFAGLGGSDLRALRILRLVARTAKMSRYSAGLRILAVAVGGRRQELLTTVGVLVVLLLLTSSLIYFAETDAQPDKFSSIPAAMWWGIITLTTVGYGDVAPVTNAGRLLAGAIAVLGVALFALPAGILASSFLEQVERRQPQEQFRCPHCPHCNEIG